MQERDIKKVKLFLGYGDDVNVAEFGDLMYTLYIISQVCYLRDAQTLVRPHTQRSDRR